LLSLWWGLFCQNLLFDLNGKIFRVVLPKEIR
jgi:hypothetical protein